MELGIGYDGHIAEILTDTPELVMHNAKFDMQKLQLAGVLSDLRVEELRFKGTLHDTQALAHLLDEHQRLGLKSLAREILGIQTVEEAEIKEWFKAKKIKKADQNYAKLPRDILIPYAEMDVDYTLRLFRSMYPKVMADPDLAAMYDIEQQLTFVLLEMERHGMKLDLDYLSKTSREYAKRGLELELFLREVSGSEEFNPNSPKQVVEALRARGIRTDSSSKDALKGLSDDFAENVLEIRSVRKIHGTYLLGLLAEHVNGLVHPWTRPFNTRTGRMSSGAAEA